MKMRKYRGWFLSMVAAMFFFGGTGALPLLAASATITFSAKNTELVLGDKLSMVLTVESSAMIQGVELYISYDAEMLEFVTGGSSVSGEEGLLKLSDLDGAQENEVKKYAISFKARKAGGCDIGISDRASVYDTNGAEMSVSSNRLSVNIAASAEQSSNNNLESLTVSPGTLKPSFHRDQKEYRVTVKSATDKLFLSAVAEQEDAVVSIEGNEGLREGKNSVVIRVKAESGKVKEYSILVTKPSAEDEAEQLLKEKPVKQPKPTGDPRFGMEKEDNQIYLTGSYRFCILDAPVEKIPDGYRSIEVALGGEEVAGYVREGTAENEFVLLYGRREEKEEAGFYVFDTREKMLLRFDGEKETLMAREPGKKDMTQKEYNEKTSRLAIIIGVLSGLCVLLALGLISLFVKQRTDSEEEE